MPLTGQYLGRYKLIKNLGSGGFGTVYQAVDESIGKNVAIKVPHRQSSDVEELSREARVMAPLQHPNVVQVYLAEKDPQSGVFFIAMEFVDGESLSDILQREGALTVDKAVPIGEEICAGVQHAHDSGILHRDLRPSNVMMTQKGVAKVMDFSVSRTLEKDAYASTRIGSPPYMAPEHFEGRAIFASDVYAIGVMLYEMLTGELPYFDVNPAKLEEQVALGRFTPVNLKNKKVDRELADVVAKAMAKDLSVRTRTAKELSGQLHPFSSSTPDQRHWDNIYQRIKERNLPVPGRCYHCRRPLPRRVSVCPSCGKKL